MNELIPIERIENRIYLIRGQKVMLDFDLAQLYKVETKVLNQAIRRNLERFPDDFMFQLTWDEVELLRSQFVTLKQQKPKKSKRGQHIKYLPYAFTEQGVAMLSSVLHSKRAIRVNIIIMRAFVKLRQVLANHKKLANKIWELEGKYSKHELEITTVFKVLKKLMAKPVVEGQPKGKIGFVVEK